MAQSPVDTASLADTFANGPVITVDEATATYPREWILMQVTELDRLQEPWAGRLLAHSRSRAEISEVKRLVWGIEAETIDLFTFFSDPRVPTRARVLQMIEYGERRGLFGPER